MRQQRSVAASDAVILTVARGQNRDLVEKAINHLRAVGARLAGVVFNRANARDFERSISGISLRSVSRASANGAVAYSMGMHVWSALPDVIEVASFAKSASWWRVPVGVDVTVDGLDTAVAWAVECGATVADLQPHPRALAITECSTPAPAARDTSGADAGPDDVDDVRASHAPLSKADRSPRPVVHPGTLVPIRRADRLQESSDHLMKIM